MNSTGASQYRDLPLVDGGQRHPHVRRTKIVATLGPACDPPDVLEGLIGAGVDVVRMNFSHGEAAEHRERARRVREIAARLDRNVGIIGDLQGPKIRVERFVDGAVTLAEGDRFVLDAGLDAGAGNAERVGVTYAALPQDVAGGDVLLLDDGRVALRAMEVVGTEIRNEVLVGGALSDHKGINRQGGGLTAPAITDKDRADIALAAEIDVDYLAVSFPRSAADLEEARELFAGVGG